MINSLINSKFFAGLTATVAFTGVMTNAGIANALVKTYTDTFELAPTDITDALLSVQKFDGNLGELQSVTIGFDGQIVGDALVESLDAQAQTLTFTLGGTLTLLGDEILNNPLFEEAVSASASFEATAFDGVMDFSGTSGKSFEGLIATLSGENLYDDQAVLDFFTGAENVEFLFSASTDSKVTGAANIFAGITTQAGASVSVTYAYEVIDGDVLSERVPEPSAILGLGLFAGAGFLSKRKVSSKA
ncbi:MAG: PEP-CTERM sorting domain-containing protein [Okeania sp. SIO3B5]|uniref:PEP-CTERM sorting domain-containing protein n=1 Tax=Okeania sp. SIO3B5 TaxID=2607811 RepID=UPI0014019414|nr:PEP-CTERM sorting domain-containing protein [Okeania sp. SIO3B5]NEO52772.1 PEP-CTERM sorting domain-containing protein [Okeania sp. SIO3B5]